MVYRLKRIGVVLSLTANIAFISGYWYNSLSFQGKTPSWLAGKELSHLMQELQLSPSQEEKVKSSTRTLFANISDVRQQIRERRVELLDLLVLPNPDREAIETKQKEIASLQQKIQQIALNHILENKTVLSDAQQEKLFSSLKARLLHQKRMKAGTH